MTWWRQGGTIESYGERGVWVPHGLDVADLMIGAFAIKREFDLGEYEARSIVKEVLQAIQAPRAGRVGVEELKSRVAELELALRPFANAADEMDAVALDCGVEPDCVFAHIEYSDACRARALLQPINQPKKETT